MNILIIEDSITVAKIIEKTLRSYGYVIQTYKEEQNIKGFLRNIPFDLVIIDTSLIKINSKELCGFIRSKYPSRFILGVCTRGSWSDRTEILNNGADDCLSFPFPTKELLARIQALLRRPKTKASVSLKYGEIKIQPYQRKAYFKEQGLDLTKKEYHLLEYMVRNKERTITRAELLDHVWDYKRVSGSNTVDVHIQKLRSKIHDRASSYINLERNFTLNTEIKTVHGVGYRLDRRDHNQNTDEDKLKAPGNL